VKSVLFQLVGWDKYILTEDEPLLRYIENMISARGGVLCKYKIVPAGVAGKVVDLMTLNQAEEFLGRAENVICILDGDQRAYRWVRNNEKVLVTPFEDVEEDLFAMKVNGELEFDFACSNHKEFYSEVIRRGCMSELEIFSLLNGRQTEGVGELQNTLMEFLNN